MNATSRILELVRQDRITPRDGALLMELRRQIREARRRDALMLGPLWRWIGRKIGLR